jgi:bis(5'-nucleosyl)-tetraphosphatase (symmetrical)
MGAMAGWIIGDVHGCWVTLQRLLDRIAWDPACDPLWLVGDLVNKGAGSLEVLRWASSTPGVGCVLGNLDLHLVARAEGRAPRRPQDTIDRVLAAPEVDDLVRWLRAQPFVRRIGDVVVVHAGVMPGWTLAEVEELGARCGRALREGGVGGMWARRGSLWHGDLDGLDRTAAAANVFTRVRMIGADDRPLLSYSGGLAEAPEGSRPWFDGAAVFDAGVRVVFGHWACLGLARSRGWLCLDSGCVYGGALSACRVDGGDVVQQPCDDEDRLQ